MINSGKYIKERYISKTIKISGNIFPFIKKLQIIRIIDSRKNKFPTMGIKNIGPTEKLKTNDIIKKMIPEINDNIFFIVKLYHI